MLGLKKTEVTKPAKTPETTSHVAVAATEDDVAVANNENEDSNDHDDSLKKRSTSCDDHKGIAWD